MTVRKPILSIRNLIKWYIYFELINWLCNIIIAKGNLLVLGHPLYITRLNYKEEDLIPFFWN